MKPCTQIFNQFPRGRAIQITEFSVCHKEVVGHTVSRQQFLGDVDGPGVHLSPWEVSEGGKEGDRGSSFIIGAVSISG